MNRRVSRAYFLIPVAYVGVIFLLFFLQYYGDELFRASISDLTISGKLDTGNPGEVASARVSYRGLSFFFDDDSGLQIERRDGSTENLPIRRYEARNDGFELLFERDARISFALTGVTASGAQPDASNASGETEEEELYVQPIIPESLLPVGRVSMKYEVAGEVADGTESVQTSLAIEHEAQTYHLTVPPRSEIRPTEREIVVPGDLERQTIRYTRLVGDPQDVVSVWFADESLAIPEAEIDALVEEYVDAAYAGWQQRFNSGNGTWEMKSGSAEFRESIVVAYLAEAWARDQYTRAFNEMRRAADLHPDQIGLASAPFLGNLREVRARFLARDDIRSRDLLEAIRTRDATVFRNADLLSYAATRGSPELLSAVLEYVPIVDYRNVDILSAVGMLANYVTADEVSDDLQKQLSRFREVAQERVLPALVKADDGFYVETGQGQVDVRSSLHAGILLATMESDDGRLEVVGRNLIASVLALAEDAGFLPAVLLVSGGTVQQTQGRIGPEDIYPLVGNSVAYPRTRSLYDEVGHGTWARTVTPFTAMSFEPTAFRFEIANVANRTHYMIFQGMPTFTSMQLFGLTWRNAADFEIYSKGRHYNATTETLMIKYYDDDPVGTIVLRY